MILLSYSVATSANNNAVNDVSEKESFEKKEREKDPDFHRYEDWGLDWSDPDMMQHPIDEGSRRVRDFCCNHIL